MQEFCLTRVIERTPKSLHAEAVLRFRRGQDRAQQGAAGARDDAQDVAEQLGDARASALLDIRLDRGSETTRFRFAALDQPSDATAVTLRRRP